MSGEGMIAEPRAMHGGNGLTTAGMARLKQLMHRGTEFLGCDYAILGGAMSWISERNLVSAISNAGGFGVIACGAMTPDLLDTEIAETKKRTTRPFGVNLITMHPMISELIDVCAAHQVTHVVLAGGIGRGEAIAAYLEMGAVGVQLGTRFVCATECIAHANFKKAFLRASARDAIPSVQIDPRLPVIPVRALKNQEMTNFAAKQVEVAGRLDSGEIEMGEAQLQIEHYWAGALKRAVIDGDVESGSVMAGQSVGMVKREEPVAEIIAELVDEAAAALDSRG